MKSGDTNGTLDQFLPNEAGIWNFGVVFTSPDSHDVNMISKVKAIMESLPPIEYDFIDLYFFRHLKQTDIAAIFGVSQPTVCYRLQRAINRIKFLLQLPQVDHNEMRRDLGRFLSDPMDIDIMVYMYDTTCQSEAAKRLGVSQGLVRHRFIRTIDRMGRNESMSFYADLFAMIAQNLNILREVRRSTNTIRLDCVID
jgi:DNA-directed RNA polymerase specialized sigma24 family protein